MGKGSETTWYKDHAKFKKAAILHHQIFFLFTSWFIIATGNPWARFGLRAPQILSMSGTILIRGLLWMLLTMLPVPEKKLLRDMGFGHFWKLS